MANELDDLTEAQLAERLREVKEELEQIARLPPMERDLDRWQALVAREAKLLDRLGQRPPD